MPKHPNIPPIIESLDHETNDNGIESTVNILGHPLHPVASMFPVAFLTGGFLSDIGYWLTGDPFWARASLWLLGAGLAGGLLAALIGMSDFLQIKRVRERSAGWGHMIGNVIALALTAVNFVPRLSAPEGTILPWGIVASTVVATLIFVTGWWGGELSYRHKIAVIGDSNRSKT